MVVLAVFDISVLADAIDFLIRFSESLLVLFVVAFGFVAVVVDIFVIIVRAVYALGAVVAISVVVVDILSLL